MDNKKQTGEPKADKPIFNPCAGAKSSTALPEARDKMPDFTAQPEARDKMPDLGHDILKL